MRRPRLVTLCSQKLFSPYGGVHFAVAIFSAALVGCSPAPVASLAVRQAGFVEAEEELSSQPPDSLNERLDAALESALKNRTLDSADNAAWQIMHAVICYGEDLIIETPDRGPVSAIEYAFSNGALNGFELRVSSEILESTGRSGVTSRFNPGSYIGQGHVDQWLAIFAMAELPLSTPLKVGDQSFTLEDWARQTQFDVPNNPIDEYSWTLIALTHYFPEESSWRGQGNTPVSWEMLLEFELDQDFESAACGGTHRLAGMISALNAHDRLGEADTPVWQRARTRIQELLQKVKDYRASDGRLSSFYFDRPGSSKDMFAELSSSGHLFEFVALAASEKTLEEPWVVASANRLCELLELTIEEDLECGALYHALRGLKVYRDRRFGE